MQNAEACGAMEGHKRALKRSGRMLRTAPMSRPPAEAPQMAVRAGLLYPSCSPRPTTPPLPAVNRFAG